jgi:hypothetical protein
MEIILDVTVLFTLALALAFLIERFLEVLVSLFHLLDSRLDWHTFWTSRAFKLRDRLEKKLKVYEYVAPQYAAKILNRFHEVILESPGRYSGTIPLIAGDLVRALWVKVITKIVGIFLGIGLTLFMKIDLVSIWRAAAGDNVAWLSHLPLTVSYIFTGIVIGLGAEPVHKIITYIEKKRNNRG